MTGEFHTFDDASGVARAAANRFVEISRSSIDASGRFSVALAGGSTPKQVYELLASDTYQSRLDWPRVHVFFGDERCVGPDDAESNYRMVNEAMLSRVPIPSENIHRIRGLGDAVSNAQLYEDEVRTYFNDAVWPRFDLVLLGMGEDGHTASLFPGSPALKEAEAWVVGNWVEKLNAYRITLTAPAINRAAQIIFLVTGQNKAERLAEVLYGARDPDRLPAQMVVPVSGTLEWFVDRPASAQLPTTEQQ